MEFHDKTSKDAIKLVQMKDETSKDCFSSKQHQIMRDRSHRRILIWRTVGGAKTLNLAMTTKQAMQHARMIRIPSGKEGDDVEYHKHLEKCPFVQDGHSVAFESSRQGESCCKRDGCNKHCYH